MHAQSSTFVAPISDIIMLACGQAAQGALSMVDLYEPLAQGSHAMRLATPQPASQRHELCEILPSPIVFWPVPHET
jgi:hypothetical protein